MNLGREIQRPLGAVLVEQGFVSHEDVDGALAEQIDTNRPLGEILLRRALIARPMLAKALAAQRGRLLEEEGGFGSGLMAKIEHLHLRRRGIDAEESGSNGGGDVSEDGESLVFDFPVGEPDELTILQQRHAELERREHELSKLAARLECMERELKRDAVKNAPTTPAA